MNRRTLIKNAGLSVAGLTVAAPFSFASPRKEQIHYGNAGHFEFNVGDLRLIAITDGHALFKPYQPIFAPGVAANEIEKVLHDNFQPTDRVDLAFNILVAKKSDRTILIDVGCGHHFGPASGRLPENLSGAGIKTTDVTDIVLTHAHSDHLGGLLNKAGKPVFPNADVYISETEYHFWMGRPDFSKSKSASDKAFTDALVKLAQQVLLTVKPRLHLFQDGAVLFDCIKARIVPGHTPGHTLMEIFSDDRRLIHMGDIAHDHVIVLSHPEWGVSFDTDFEEAAVARRKILEELSAKRARVFSYHLPWPGIGYIRKKDAGFEWLHEAYATPVK